MSCCFWSPETTEGRVKLTVLSEDRLQIKWKEADGPVQGYKVHVKALSGETTKDTDEGDLAFRSDPPLWPPAAEPQPELMLSTTRGRATVAGLDSRQEYSLRILLLSGSTERLWARRTFTSEHCCYGRKANRCCCRGG